MPSKYEEDARQKPIGTFAAKGVNAAALQDAPKKALEALAAVFLPAAQAVRGAGIDAFGPDAVLGEDARGCHQGAQLGAGYWAVGGAGALVIPLVGHSHSFGAFSLTMN